MLTNRFKNFIIISLAVLLFSVSANAQEATTSGDTLYYDLKPAFTVNYGGPGKLRYLKTDVALRIKRENQGINKVEKHEMAIRHALVMFLTRQSDEDVSTAAGREMIRLAALSNIQKLIEKETGEQPVVDLLFKSFVVQR